MAETAAVGSGPVLFLSADGRQLSLPLGQIYFDASGAVRARGEAETEHPGLRPWLDHLVRHGHLAPGRTPAPAVAMLVEAADDGSSGNDTTVTVAGTADATRVDVTVTIADVRRGVTLSGLRAELGSREEAGRRPGLLRVMSLPDPLPEPVDQAVIDPAEAMPDPPPAGYRPTWAIAGDANASVQLEARRTQMNADLMTVSISDVDGDPGSKTFTLTAVWRHTIQGVAAADLPDALDGVGFAIELRPPEGGYRLPRPGTVRLGGGRDASLAGASVLAEP